MDLPRALGLEICTTMQKSHGSATYQVMDVSVKKHRALRVLTPRCTLPHDLSMHNRWSHVYVVADSDPSLLLQSVPVPGLRYYLLDTRVM